MDVGQRNLPSMSDRLPQAAPCQGITNSFEAMFYALGAICKPLRAIADDENTQDSVRLRSTFVIVDICKLPRVTPSRWP